VETGLDINIKKSENPEIQLLSRRVSYQLNLSDLVDYSSHMQRHFLKNRKPFASTMVVNYTTPAFNLASLNDTNEYNWQEIKSEIFSCLQL
jgi:hypothetical protein